MQLIGYTTLFGRVYLGRKKNTRDKKNEK